MESSDMTMMMSASCCALALVVGAALVAMNPSWLSNLSGRHSPGVIDWATGAPSYTIAPTQSPYVLPIPPLYTTPGPVYVWPQQARQ